MVVVGRYAFVARATVLRTKGLLYVTHGTVPQVDHYLGSDNLVLAYPLSSAKPLLMYLLCVHDLYNPLIIIDSILILVLLLLISE